MTAFESRDDQIRNSVVVNTLSNFVGKTIVLALSFLLTPFILQYLGQELYGLWAIFGSILGYGILLDFGISGALIRYLSGYRAVGEYQQASRIVSTAFILYVAIGAAAVIMGILLAPLLTGLFQVQQAHQQTAVQLIILAVLGIGITIPWIFAGAVLRGLQRFDLLNIIVVFGSLFYWAGIFIVLWSKGTLLAFGLAHLAMMVLMTGLGFWQIRRNAPEIKIDLRKLDRAVVIKIFSFSIALFVIAIASQLQSQTSEILIGAFLPIAAVTPYYLARRLSEIPQMLTDQFMRVLLPLASHLSAENDQVRIRSLYLTGTRLTLAGLLPVAIVLMILARPILSAWVGDDYAPFAHLVTLLTLATLIRTSQWPASNILQSMNRQKELAWASVASASTSIGLSIALIGPLGITGVAIATLVPAVLESLGFIFPYTLRALEISWKDTLRQVLIPAGLPALPAVLILFVLRQVVWPESWFHILVEAAAAVLCYVSTYLWFGASLNERRAYIDLIDKTRISIQKYLMRP